jgi:predicted dehydrogenase
MSKTINVGLIGFGGAGRVFHAPVISSVEGLKLYKVFETKKENINILKSKYKDVLLASELEDIFNDENIELVVIAVPNKAHFDLASRALNSGKNVLVEKPFTVTSKEADELIRLSKEKDKILTVHQNRRWDSDFRTVKEIINNNLLGDLVEYEVHYDRFRNYFKQNSWREESIEGSGILYDLGAHLIDQAQYLFGTPKKIFADIRIQRQGGKTNDNFEVILDYSELKVTLKAGMLVRGKIPHFMLLGTKGTFIKYGMDPQEEDLKIGIMPKDKVDFGKEIEENWGEINTEINGSHVVGKIESEAGDYRQLYRNVYLSILGEEELIVTPQQARNTIKIIEIAEESNKEKAWIQFN